MLKLTFEARRWIVIALGVPFFFILLNWVAGWEWFGANDRKVASAALLLMVLLAFFVAPTPAEMRRNNAKRMLRSRRRKEP
jgi:hypothetical protein